MVHFVLFTHPLSHFCTSCSLPANVLIKSSCFGTQHIQWLCRKITSTLERAIQKLTHAEHIGQLCVQKAHLGKISTGAKHKQSYSQEVSRARTVRLVLVGLGNGISTKNQHERHLFCCKISLIDQYSNFSSHQCLPVTALQSLLQMKSKTVC